MRSRSTGSRARARSDYEIVRSDAGASYEATLKYDLSGLEPQVACPHTVDNVKPVREVEGQPFHQALIGTCTNGRLGGPRGGGEDPQGPKDPSVRPGACPAGFARRLSRRPAEGTAGNPLRGRLRHPQPRAAAPAWARTRGCSPRARLSSAPRTAISAAGWGTAIRRSISPRRPRRRRRRLKERSPTPGNTT